MESSHHTESHQEREASPMAGCLIFIILILVFSTLGAFIVYTYQDHKKAVLSFSESEPGVISEYLGGNGELSALNKKLSVFSNTVKEGGVTEIAIGVKELNLAISKLPKMQEFKGKMFVTSISKEGIEANISFPMKAGFSSLCYLNGSMMVMPQIAQGSIFPVITSVSPASGADVPPKMVKFLPQALFSSYRTDPDLQSVFHKLSTVVLEDGIMKVTSDPQHIPMDEVDIVAGKDNFYTALSLFGILFFIVFSTSVLVYYFFKRRKRKSL